ncbi:MAG: AmmeMemoRadiSam system protein B, partial [Candidatus Gracilibacteria bacterium]
MTQLRKPAVSGQFYPSNPAMLKQMIMGFFEKTAVAANGAAPQLKALIVPHAGYIYSGPVAAYGYKLLKGLDQTKKWKILLLGLSHFIPVVGAAASSYSKWET